MQQTDGQTDGRTEDSFPEAADARASHRHRTRLEMGLQKQLRLLAWGTLLPGKARTSEWGTCRRLLGWVLGFFGSI